MMREVEAVLKDLFVAMTKCCVVIVLKTAKGNVSSCKLSVSRRRVEVWWCGAGVEVGFCRGWGDMGHGWSTDKHCAIYGMVACKDCRRCTDG